MSLTEPAGGLRDRYIIDSFRLLVATALTELGHDTPGRAEGADPRTVHRQYAVTLVADTLTGRLDQGEPVEPNKVVVSFGPTETGGAELGSGLTNVRWAVLIDIFGESDAIARHVAGDLQAWLRSRLPGTTRDTDLAAFDVLDLSDPDRAVLFACDIENVRTDAPPGAAPVNNWHVVECDVVDVQ